MLSPLSGWSNEEFGVSFNAAGLAHAITVDELPEEIRKVVTAIEKSSKFS
jgi:hypothetical protein